MEKLKEILNGYNKPSILDIATGVGSFISIITQLTENYSKIIGIDVFRCEVSWKPPLTLSGNIITTFEPF